MTKLTVTVTQDHINNGERMSPNRCPVALAIREQNPKLTHVSVGGCQASLWINNNKYKEGILPPAAQGFIADFDQFGRRTVEPISFEMTLEQAVSND